ncbi:MAG: hypothetical protein NTX74_00435 [Flavobacterium sp.]|nr:hypothetical protein [Flavobacterium sp.]
MRKLSGINVRKKEEGGLVCGFGYIWETLNLKIMKNYVLHSLAIVGAISLIIMACSADNSNNTNTPNNTNALGKYQISSSPNSNLGKYHVIDTETGIVKTYEKTSSNGNYVLISTTNP